MQRDVNISLRGNFAISVDGRDVPIASSRGRAILAVLATSDRHKRARDVLKAMMWPTRAEEQAGGSLRTALTSIRRELGEAAGVIGSNRTHVWLADGVAVELPENGETLFEDAPSNVGSEFEDWLQTERSRWSITPSHRPGLPMVAERNVCIGILPARERVDEPHAALLGRRVLDLVVESLQAYDAIDLFDFRDLGRDHFAGACAPVTEPNMLVELELLKVGVLAQLTISVRETATRKLLWNNSVAADQSGPFLFTADQVQDFANHAVDAILIATFRHQEGARLAPGTPPSSMVGVLHQLFGMSSQGQRSVRSFLSGRGELERSATANACFALSIANTLGEDRAHAADIEAAHEHAVRATELDPQNPLVLSLVGHVYGFVLHQPEVGSEMLSMARKLAPNLAFAWDFSAMNAIYRGAFSEASDYSRTAMRLGQFSPYRGLFQSSQAICATLTEDHDLAVRTARCILARMPDYLAVMRHSTASLVALGRHEEALQTVQRIRAKDPMFSPEGILEPDYPLPCAVSRNAIGQSFARLGIAP